jgi:hypothetical protein
MKRLLAFLVAIVAAAALAVPASAAGAGAVSYTQTLKNYVQTFTSDIPCAGTGTITTTSNSIFHVTFLTSGIGAGTFWATGTDAGTVVAVAGSVTYTGHFADWFGDNDNLNNGNEEFNLNVHLTGSDGSVINGHLVAHVSASATGIVVTFFKVTCS